MITLEELELPLPVYRVFEEAKRKLLAVKDADATNQTRVVMDVGLSVQIAYERMEKENGCDLNLLRSYFDEGEEYLQEVFRELVI